jgi:hypothetical protein
LKRWDWIFLENTANAPMYYLVADAGDRFAGQYATMPVRLQHDGKPVLGLLSLDTATDPDFGRQGIFTTLARQLYEQAAEEAPIVFGFPNASSAPGFYRKLGWVELRPLPLLIRPLGNAKQALGAWRPKLAPVGSLIALLTPLIRAFEHAVKLTAERGSASVQPLESFSGWTDDLWAQLSPDLGTCAVRDATYLNWRFCSSPYTYHRYVLHRGTAPIGFAVTAFRPSRVGKLAYLMELMAPKNDRAGARLLLAHAFLDAAHRGATAMLTLATRRHPHRRAMLQSGFVPSPEHLNTNLSFGVRDNGPGSVPNNLFHIDDWYLSGADLDTI